MGSAPPLGGHRPSASGEAESEVNITTIPLTAPQRAALAELAKAELCRRDFVRFLGYVKVRSDDPLNPVVTDWQPWDYLTEQARLWASGESEIVLKDRQLGYSWLVAAYSVWRARSGAMVALISKGQLEARELLAKCRFVEDHLPVYIKHDRFTPKVDELRFGEGAILAFPSTPDAGVSFTFQLVVMDEAHFHPYAAENYTAIRPTISAGGQLIVLSTADPSLGPYGWFPEMYWASKRGETGYVARFIPWHVRPGRDKDWYERERSSYAGNPDAFSAYYANTDAEAFVGKSGLVFPAFDESVHVWAPHNNLDHPWGWNDSIRKVAGVDFGGGDPTAVVPLGLSGQHQVHQFGEFYRKGAVSVLDIANFLAQYPGPGTVVCDPSQTVAIESLDVALRGTGWTARKADNKRGEGLEAVQLLLESQRLTIHSSCKSSLAEFPGYRWAERTDPSDKSRYQTKTPIDHHADAMDARRYAVVELLAMTRPMAQMPTRSITGHRLATRAV